MVWYSHLFKNVPQFVVIYTVKGFGIINKADGFLDGFQDGSLAFSMIQQMLESLVSLPFSKFSLNIWKFSVYVLLKPDLAILSITLLTCQMSAIVQYFEHSLALSSFGIGMKTDFSSPVATAEFSKSPAQPCLTQ